MGKIKTFSKMTVLFAAVLFCSATLAQAAVDVGLRWDANTDTVTGYKVYYKTGSSGSPYNGTGSAKGNSPIEVPLSNDENPAADTVDFTVTGLTDGETYYFVVTAYNDTGESGYSNEVNTGSSGDTTPPQISNVNVDSTTTTTAVIEWTTDENSDSVVRYGTSSTSWGNYPSNKSDSSKVTSHSVTLTGLTANTRYYFRVGSTDEAGNGPTTSSESSFTTTAETPDTDTDGDGTPDATDTDDDNDGLPDTVDPDPLDSTGDTGRDGDYDNDGWTNYEEYQNGTDLTDANDPVSTPPTVAQTMPHNNAGIGSDSTVLPYDTSFAVRFDSMQGIDLTDTSSIGLTIDDGVNAPYEVDLSNTNVVRVTKLTSEADTAVTELWVVYDRSNDDSKGNSYEFGATVTVLVDAKDKRGDSMTQASYSFRVETQAEYDDRMGNQPNTNEQTQGDSKAVTLITSDDRNGTKIEYDVNEPVVPYFELTELPALDVPNVETVGLAVDLQPPTVFDNPVRVTIPCPGVEDVRTLGLYLYNGQNWVYACSPYNDGGGVVQAGGEGWMVPNSLAFNNNTNPPTLEVEVYHFSAIQPGLAAQSGGIDTNTEEEATNSSGGCFITTTGPGSEIGHVNPVALLLGLMLLLSGSIYWIRRSSRD